VTLSLATLLRQDVIPEGLFVLIAFGGSLEPFGCTTTGFHFGHFHTPHFKCFSLVSPCWQPIASYGTDVFSTVSIQKEDAKNSFPSS
jgi:hypothetical protein